MKTSDFRPRISHELARTLRALAAYRLTTIADYLDHRLLHLVQADLRAAMADEGLVQDDRLEPLEVAPPAPPATIEVPDAQ